MGEVDMTGLDCWRANRGDRDGSKRPPPPLPFGVSCETGTWFGVCAAEPVVARPIVAADRLF